MVYSCARIKKPEHVAAVGQSLLEEIKPIRSLVTRLPVIAVLSPSAMFFSQKARDADAHSGF